jgi:hypothetical protein
VRSELEESLEAGLEVRLADAVERITRAEYRQAADELQAILTAVEGSDAASLSSGTTGGLAPGRPPGPVEPNASVEPNAPVEPDVSVPPVDDGERLLRARARFWLALCQERLGEVRIAAENYRLVASEHPDTRMGRNALRRAVELDVWADGDESPPAEGDEQDGASDRHGSSDPAE